MKCVLLLIICIRGSIQRLPYPVKTCYTNENSTCLGAECDVEKCDLDYHDSCLTQKVRISREYVWTYKCARKPNNVFYKEVNCCYDDDGYSDCRKYTYGDLSNEEGYLNTIDHPPHEYCDPVEPGIFLFHQIKITFSNNR